MLVTLSMTSSVLHHILFETIKYQDLNHNILFVPAYTSMDVSKMIIAAIQLVCFFRLISGALFDTSHSNADGFASGSGDLNKRGQNQLPCCVFGNLSFHSIADILNNISSNNTIVNITTDVVLSCNVTIEGFENITIIGYGNPAVKCNDVGAVKFISCNH